MLQLNLFKDHPAVLKPSDIENIPKELLAQLNISDTTKTNFEIINIIDKYKGGASVDLILVSLYNRTGIIHNKKSLLNRLYKMSKKGQVYLVPKKKSIYTTINPNNP